jgi:uncharacterized protein (DUF1499 family)
MTAPLNERPAPVARRGLPVIVVFGLLVSLLGAVVVAASGFGFRNSIWPIRVAFELLTIGGWIGLGGGVISVLAAALTRPGTGRRGFLLSLLGVIIGLGAFGLMADQRLESRSDPPIDDITTDFATPPDFVAVLPLRAGAAPATRLPASGSSTVPVAPTSPTQYGGAEVAAQQRSAYPDIGPADLPIPPGAAFRMALAEARNLGWEIVSADSSAGHIEASARTPWFGFTDDIVVRVSATEQGTRIDVRSLSRVGPEDIAVNARRVRRYIADLKRAV